MTEYEAIREKAANQKRDVEKALTKFLAKTNETISLFDAEDTMFPCMSSVLLYISFRLLYFYIISVIACKPMIPSYLAALNPTDQVFDFEELEYHYQVANRTSDDGAASNKGNIYD